MKWEKWKQRWYNLAISRKLSIVIGGILGFLIFATILSTILFFSMAQRNEQVLSKQETWFSQQEVKHYIYARINSVLEYISTGDETFLQRFYQDCEAARSYENYLWTQTPEEQRSEIEHFIQLSQDWEFVLLNQVIPVYQLGNVADAWVTIVEKAEPMQKQLIEEVSYFSDQKEAEILELSRSSTAHGERFMYLGLLLTVVAMLMAIVLFVVLKNSINRPIEILHRGTQRLAKGDFYYRVSIKGQDEFGQLGAAFNLMGERVNALIDELHATNKQLKIESKNAKAANRLKTDFLATVSHELRTPLNGIIGLTEAIQEQLAGPLTEKQQEYISHIYSNAEHLLDLINEILDLSKIEAGKMELNYQEIDVSSFFSRIINMLLEFARNKDVQLHYENHSTVRSIWADPKRITEIMNNLLSNAIKFTPSGGSVSVTIDQTKKSLAISVQDTGIGIGKEGLEKIFVPFYQDVGAWNTQYEGTGLGLALTHKLVELHGGTVTVDSTIDVGTTFTVHLPLEQRKRVEESHPILPIGTKHSPFLADSTPSIWLVGEELERIHSFAVECMGKYSTIIFEPAQFEHMWEAAQQYPTLVFYFTSGAKEKSDDAYLEQIKIAARQIRELDIPILMITSQPFTLLEKGLIFQYVKDIIDPEQIDVCQWIDAWVSRNGGRRIETE